MGFFDKFFNPRVDDSGDITNPFESTISDDFLRSEARSLLRSICFDALARVRGIPTENVKMLYDSPSASDSPTGLVSLIVDAMMTKGKCFIVIKNGVIRAADAKEKELI
jgi:hypothetical protein